MDSTTLKFAVEIAIDILGPTVVAVYGLRMVARKLWKLSVW